MISLRARVALLSAVLVLGAVPVAAIADSPSPNGGDLVAACSQATSQQPLLGTVACRNIQQDLRGTAATCRIPMAATGDPAATERCAVFDGRPVSDARITTYRNSWVHRALDLQRGLDAAAPLAEEQLPHTHNTFNASSYRVPSDPSRPGYYPTLTNQDPNQVYSISDQLQMDIRAIEIDVHWVPSPFGSTATGGKWVTMCHGNSQDPIHTGVVVHIGCTYDRPFQDGLQELAGWLDADANRDQVVLLYLENQLSGDPAGHQVAGDLIDHYLGSRVYKTPVGQNCAAMPLDVSRADILRAGSQVLIVGNCDAGAGATTSWGRFVHARGPKWDESGGPGGYDAKCAADSEARRTDASFRRYFEDSTWLAAMVGSNPVTSSLGGTTSISATTTAAMVKCGVNIIGMDQLVPEDPRLAALVWSWAENEPSVSGTGCAYQGSDGRFRTGGCGESRHFACVDGNGAWQVSAAEGVFVAGATACPTGTKFAAPANGYRNQLIVQAKATASVNAVWVNYRDVNGVWTPNT